ncbi:16S rRNA (guanine(966)-N(2))-methyltransferase RsmD [Franzmannia qiaohouensis]|uniref:Ribosomal RNA small subunit methyltransferase D n=1 Tax=Franzmannia qiaohouensis TaxID=1329370 RepID=A0ABU1HFN7_9GAMM|nr:16S rRNA (guanine(966)-N(2))-methyltransferase RsmD [Halomonas qiaohouensis]MDR5906291.1 16S rRNA (guanine(966)-N(2))-methyltransferase RsmD [Halomonas qiaohouensis]
MTRRRAPSHRRPASKAAGRLRIIGGEFRRRLLPVLDRPGLRPTPDRVRETLFNWLAGAPPGAQVLDLYAGTGALGLEALSRGARQAHFVEGDAAVASTLRSNLATLGANGQVTTGDVMALLDAPADAAAPYALVFLDPPFRRGLAEPSCTALEAGGWLAERAWIYLETEAELTPRVPASWILHREVRAGDSHARLYRRLSSPGDAC